MPVYMRRKGPLITVVIGAFLNFAGYALLYMAATGSNQPSLLASARDYSIGKQWPMLV